MGFPLGAGWPAFAKAMVGRRAKDYMGRRGNGALPKMKKRLPRLGYWVARDGVHGLGALYAAARKRSSWGTGGETPPALAGETPTLRKSSVFQRFASSVTNCPASVFSPFWRFEFPNLNFGIDASSKDYMGRRGQDWFLSYDPHLPSRLRCAPTRPVGHPLPLPRARDLPPYSGGEI